MSDFDADFLKAPGTEMPNEGTERQKTRLNVFHFTFLTTAKEACRKSHSDSHDVLWDVDIRHEAWLVRNERAYPIQSLV